MMAPFTNNEAPHHGADIAAASRRYGIPIGDWLDLSTGINPHAYPLPLLANAALQHLPSDFTAACSAAQNYCAATVPPVFAAGSQAIIQWLPFVHRRLCAGRRVAVPTIGYAEHAFRWQWAGYELVFYDPRAPELIDELLQRRAIDVLVVINPHNPLGTLTTPEKLLAWHAALANHNGWLIVDEAFIDAVPQYSVASMAHLPDFIVLRSLGKFFGLAGVRCGYAFCCEEIARQLRIALGPWPLSGVALAAATAALGDVAWQQSMCAQLQQLSAQNAALLAQADWAKSCRMHRHALFNSIELSRSRALTVENNLAERAIRMRRIDIDREISLLRFGLIDIDDAQARVRLEQAIFSQNDVPV